MIGQWEGSNKCVQASILNNLVRSPEPLVARASSFVNFHFTKQQIPCTLAQTCSPAAHQFSVISQLPCCYNLLVTHCHSIIKCKAGISGQAFVSERSSSSYRFPKVNLQSANIVTALKKMTNPTRMRATLQQQKAHIDMRI